MAGRPEAITPAGTLREQTWRSRASHWREGAAAQLAPKEWPGLVLAPLEWGAVVARLVLATSGAIVLSQVDELGPALPAVVALIAALFAMSLVYIFLLRKGMVRTTLAVSIVADTITVLGGVIGTGLLLHNEGVDAIPLAAQGINGSAPIFLVVMLSVIRLRLLPGAIYSIFIPVLFFAAMRITGTDPIGLDGAIPRTITMAFAGFATIAVAYPIQMARRDLVRAVNEKVELVSTVAHELRGPLTSTRAYIELIRDEAAGGITEQQRSMLDRAMRSATRMEQLIGLFLNVERAENEDVKPVLESVDLGSAARDVVDSMVPLASDREISIELHNIDALPAVTGERQSTDQVLANLLSNAIKFSPDRSVISVAGYLEGDQAGLTISDHGVGISPEDQRNIFQRFYRSEDPRKRRVRGTGLGLYVSRRLMEKMGGNIWFKSIPGDGSTFGFSLPSERSLSPSGRLQMDDASEDVSTEQRSQASA